MKFSGLLKTLGSFFGASTAPRSVPVLTNEMVESGGKPITAAMAKKMYRDFLVATGARSKEFSLECAEDLGDRMRDFEDELKYELESAAEETQSAKDQLQSTKQEIGRSKDLDEEDSLSLEDAKSRMDECKLEETTIRSRLAQFRADKRQFLIAYANHELHHVPSPEFGMHGDLPQN